jgi:hypothetical protein
MFYRLSVGTIDGIARGYQWREIDQDLFTAILSGTRPLADQEAQTRDDSARSTLGEDRPMHYLAVWDRHLCDWIQDWPESEARAHYTAVRSLGGSRCGFDRAGA